MKNKFKIGDIVANIDKCTIGIILDDFKDGDYRTDADGVVYGSDLEYLNINNHKMFHCSPSIFNKISCFQPKDDNSIKIYTKEQTINLISKYNANERGLSSIDNRIEISKWLEIKG